MAILRPVLAYAQSSGAPESPGNISSWLSLDNGYSHCATITVNTVIELWCHNMRHGLTNWRQHCSLFMNIMYVRAHLWSASQGVGVCDMAGVFMLKLHLLLPGMSWPILLPLIEVQAHLRSAIQSWMTFLDFNEVHFGQRRLIGNGSFQVRQAWTGTIRLRSACSPLHSALYIIVCFILIMFSSALNQWTLCTQIAISEDIADLGAGGSSRSPSADISIYAWSVWDGHR